MQQAMSMKNARRAMFAGNALLTFQSLRTNKWFTYRIQAGSNQREPWYVSVLTGDEQQYRYIGHIFKNQERVFHPGKKSSISESSPSVMAFGYVFENLLMSEDPSWMSNKVKIYHQGKCSKCGRPLTTPHSIEIGIGPHCLAVAG